MITRLKELRLKKGMSQSTLAKKANIGQSHVAMIENGQRMIDLKMLETLSKALGCKPYELLPIEWQPETVSEADLQILRSIKSYATDKQNEEKAKNSQIQKESER